MVLVVVRRPGRLVGLRETCSVGPLKERGCLASSVRRRGARSLTECSEGPKKGRMVGVADRDISNNRKATQLGEISGGLKPGASMLSRGMTTMQRLVKSEGGNGSLQAIRWPCGAAPATGTR